MATRNPYKIKRLAKQLPNSKEWQTKENDLMKELLKAKFSQNKHLTDLLIDTGDKQLHESTSDHKWGTGAELASKALSNVDWTGQDLLGQLIEEVHDELTESLGVTTPTQRGTADPAPDLAGDLDNITPMDDEPEIEATQDYSLVTVRGRQSSRHSHVTTSNGNKREERYDSTSSQASLTSPHSMQSNSPTSYSQAALSPKSLKSQSGSPSSTQAIIKDLAKKQRRAAPTPPVDTLDGTGIKPRGNRTTRTPAAPKGKS